MSFSVIETKVPNVIGVKVSGNKLSVELSDGEMVSVPVDWYPRLAHATKRERANWRIIGRGHGIHWEEIDEDISVEGLRAGRRSGESERSLKKWLKAKSEPNFPPWKGKDYGGTNDLGLPAKLLIVGESHYGEAPTTIGVVRKFCQEGGHKLKFFTNIMLTVLGPDTPCPYTSEQRTGFHNSIAFYNYVQRPVGPTPSVRPNREMLEEAAAPFLTTLKRLCPTHILVCGKTQWNYMPEPEDVWEPPSEELIGWFDPVDFPQRSRLLRSRPLKHILGYYRHSKGQSVVLAIHHPSRRYHPAWHPVVKRFLEYRFRSDRHQ